MAEPRAGVPDLEGAPPSQGASCLLCLFHLLCRNLLFILNQQIHRYLHIVEFVLVCNHARRLVLLFQLKMSLILINVHLQHFDG